MYDVQLDANNWKDVEGYEGYYRISNFGSVIGLDRVFEKIFFDKKVKVVKKIKKLIYNKK